MVIYISAIKEKALKNYVASTASPRSSAFTVIDAGPPNPKIVGKSYENRDGRRHKPYQLVQGRLG